MFIIFFRARNSKKKELLLLEQNLNNMSTLVQFQQSRTDQSMNTNIFLLCTEIFLFYSYFKLVTGNVERWTTAVEKDEKHLKEVQQSLAEKVEEYEATMQKLQNVENQQKAILEKQNELDEEIAKVYPNNVSSYSYF